MTNLDSILKKERRYFAMIVPVVIMDVSWTIKKAEY